MKSFELKELLRRQAVSEHSYFEFLRESTLSMGVYVLPAGGIDPQRPHLEDEVYYVVSGKGMINVDEENKAVVPGSIVFVGRHIDHRFYDISEELTVLVFFAPPES